MAEKRKIRNMCDVAERLENIGFRKGEISTVIKLVASGKLEFEEGANLLNMSVADLMQKLREAGYSEEDFQHGN